MPKHHEQKFLRKDGKLVGLRAFQRFEEEQLINAHGHESNPACGNCAERGYICIRWSHPSSPSANCAKCVRYHLRCSSACDSTPLQDEQRTSTKRERPHDTTTEQQHPLRSRLRTIQETSGQSATPEHGQPGAPRHLQPAERPATRLRPPPTPTQTPCAPKKPRLESYPISLESRLQALGTAFMPRGEQVEYDFRPRTTDTVADIEDLRRENEKLRKDNEKLRRDVEVLKGRLGWIF